MNKFNENSYEMYGFVEEDGNDIFAADDHNSVKMYGVGRPCQRCGNYFMITGRDDKRWICPDCMKEWKSHFAKISDEEGG